MLCLEGYTACSTKAGVPATTHSASLCGRVRCWEQRLV